MQHHLRDLCLVVTLTACTGTAMALLQYKTKDDITLPPVGSREIIGTWLTTSLPPAKCTRSFEKVKGKVYDVVRCSDGSGGDDGRLVTQIAPSKFKSRTSTSGDHYVILANGDLSVRDKYGEIGVEPKHAGLWPTTTSRGNAEPMIEDKKTVGLNCYVIGYRFGFTATRSLKGKSTDPAWDFATPNRCKSDPETQRGINAGTKAAW